jgi:hypothetical protein
MSDGGWNRPRRGGAIRNAVDWDGMWTNFQADAFRPGFHVSSSDEDCAAELHFKIGDSIHTIVGKTGEGHAEMNALRQLIILCKYDAEVFTQILRAGVTVVCIEKPCCYRCSCILGALGIVASVGTRKNAKKMGKTQWGGLSEEDRAFIEAHLGITKYSIESLAQ